MPRPAPHGSLTSATIRACAADQDCWPARASVSLPVLPPTGHTPDQTALPAVVEVFVPETDSARLLRSQSADLPGARQRDRKSRNTPDRRPHCTALHVAALRDKSIR